MIRDRWLNDLALACGTPVTSADLIDLTETARLKNSFTAKLADKDSPCWKAQWTKNCESDAYRVLAALGTQGIGIKFVLFSSVDDLIGACVVDASAVLEHAADVWKVVKNDLNLATADLAAGVCLESNYSSEQGGYLLDLSAWGRFFPSEIV